MQDANQSSGRIRFSLFEVDLQAGQLRKRGVPVRLQPQPFRVLEILLEHAGEVVTREDLKKELWPSDSFGDFEHGLNKAINKIRDAINDSPRNPRFVETIARRGYRFIGDVEVINQSPSSRVVTGPPAQEQADVVRLATQPQAQTVRGRFEGVKVFGVAALLALASLLIWRWRIAVGNPTYNSLAVLPFDNLSHDQSQEYFADGMTDELITTLGTISGLRVISRTSIMSYKHNRRALRDVSRELNADLVVEGTLIRDGEDVRINAQLILAKNDEQLWSHSYRGNILSMLQLQDQVAREIADHIHTTLIPHNQLRLTYARPTDPKAYDDYLRGRFFWNKRTEVALKRAIDFFNLAIAIDPNYDRAYSGLADSYALLGDWEFGGLPPEQAFPKAKAAAIKAIALNDSLGEAHASLGLCLKSFDWDWKAADRELRRAIELSPSYATAHQWYAWNLIMLGNTAEGLKEMKKAESIDPLSLIIAADVADALLIAHQSEAAREQSRKVMEMDPSFSMAHYQMGQTLVQLGRYDEAAGQLQEAIQLSNGNPICLSQLGYCYALSGRKNEAMEMLNQLKSNSGRHYVNAANIALIYVGLKDKDQALMWLEKAYEQRFNPSLLSRPAFNSIRSDPFFQNLLVRLGLSIPPSAR